MQFAKVVNGEVVQVGLPTTGELSDGRTVSGFHLLDAEVLLTEGWLPVVDNPPTYDTETEMLQLVGYSVAGNQVAVNYSVVLKPQIIPTLEEQVTLLKIRLAMAEQSTAEMSLTQQQMLELLIDAGVI